MHCTLSITALHRALTAIQKIPTKHPTLPILAYMVFEVTEGNLKIRCTNLGIAVEWNIPATNTKEGSCALDANIILASFSAETGDIDISLESNLCICMSGGSVIQLKTLPTEDMPTLPAGDMNRWCELFGTELAALVQSVSFAAATSDIRPEIASVFLTTRSNMLIAAATDSFKLAESRVPISYESETNVLIPVRYTADIIRICNTINNSVTLYTADGILFLVSDSVKIAVRIITGAYPDYEQIIPKQPVLTAECSKDELKTALRVVLPFTDQSFTKIDVSFDGADGLITLETGVHEQGSGKSNCRSLIVGQLEAVRVNAKILSEIIAILPDDQIIIAGTESNRPLLIKGSKTESIRCLLMPLTR
jgi:DNA polymerase III subunit beta